MNNSVLVLCILSLVTLTVGCQPTEITDRASGYSNANGYFEGEVVASWDNDGRKMTLREDFSYVDPNNRRWLAPAGSVVDGASIPSAFWTFIGGPFEGQYRKASVVHDVGCIEMTASWEDVHRMFYDACLDGGVDEQTAKVMYYAVYHFGPRWEPGFETVVETHENEQGHLVQERFQRRKMRCICPEPPTPEEIQQVVEMVADDNPSTAELVRTTREELHRRPLHKRNFDRYQRQPSEAFAPSRRSTGRQDIGLLAGHETTQYDQRSERALANRSYQSLNHRGAGDGRGEQTAMTEDEEQWVARQVYNHLVNRLRQPEPDTYDVDRTQDGYRVRAWFYERNRQGQPIENSNNHSNLTARVSAAGEVLEILR